MKKKMKKLYTNYRNNELSELFSIFRAHFHLVPLWVNKLGSVIGRTPTNHQISISASERVAIDCDDGESIDNQCFLISSHRRIWKLDDHYSSLKAQCWWKLVCEAEKRIRWKSPSYSRMTKWSLTWLNENVVFGDGCGWKAWRWSRENDESK